MFKDVRITLNDFLELLEKKAGGKVARVYREGYRKHILSIVFEEEVVNYRLRDPKYGLAYYLDSGTIEFANLKYGEERDSYSLRGLYMYAHPEANVVGVEPTWDGGFILKVRCNDAAQG